MSYSFAETENEERDIAVFTKRFDALLAPAGDTYVERGLVLTAFAFLSDEPYFGERTQAKLREAAALIADVPRLSSRVIAHARQLEADFTQRRSEVERNFERKPDAEVVLQLTELDNAIEYQRSIAARWEKRALAPQQEYVGEQEVLVAALSEVDFATPFYRQVLANTAYATLRSSKDASLRKALQALLAVRGFEEQLPG